MCKVPFIYSLKSLYRIQIRIPKKQCFKSEITFDVSVSLNSSETNIKRLSFAELVLLVLNEF